MKMEMLNNYKWFSHLLCLLIVVLTSSQLSQAKITIMVPNNVVTPSPTQSPKIMCRCQSAAKDITVCANNGLTYTSTCEFQCHKNKIKNLKVIKEGTCAGVSQDEYWGR